MKVPAPPRAWYNDISICGTYCEFGDTVVYVATGLPPVDSNLIVERYLFKCVFSVQP